MNIGRHVALALDRSRGTGRVRLDADSSLGKSAIVQLHERADVDPRPEVIRTSSRAADRQPRQPDAAAVPATTPRTCSSTLPRGSSRIRTSSRSARSRTWRCSSARRTRRRAWCHSSWSASGSSRSTGRCRRKGRRRCSSSRAGRRGVPQYVVFNARTGATTALTSGPRGSLTSCRSSWRRSSGGCPGRKSTTSSGSGPRKRSLLQLQPGRGAGLQGQHGDQSDVPVRDEQRSPLLAADRATYAEPDHLRRAAHFDDRHLRL